LLSSRESRSIGVHVLHHVGNSRPPPPNFPLLECEMTTVARPRLDALTGLRFLAAFAIIMHHSRDVFFPAILVDGLPLATGVSLFFVLSGFILAYVYSSLPTKYDILHFYVARIARVWPVHIFALLLFLVVVPVSVTTETMLANVLMVHGWIPLKSFYFSYNAVSWSISTEFGFYLLFPLLIAGFKVNWLFKLIGSVALVLIAIALCQKFDIPDYSPNFEGISNHGVLYINPLVRLLEFTIGMCFALFWTRASLYLTNSIIVWSLLEVLAVSLLSWHLMYGRSYLYGFIVHQSIAPVSVSYLKFADGGVFFGLLIFSLASGAGIFARILSTPAFVFLGEISYSAYMTHLVLISAYQNHRDVVPSLPFLLFLSGLFVLCSATYFLIERPARGMVSAIFKTRRASLSLPQSANESAK
jgi:peptidoglycan/LPS O-acetylase OafA/YrhL